MTIHAVALAEEGKPIPSVSEVAILEESVIHGHLTVDAYHFLKSFRQTSVKTTANTVSAGEITTFPGLF